MDYESTRKYLRLMLNLTHTNASEAIKDQLKEYQSSIYDADLEKIYGEPMKGIGYYIVFASLCCIVAMGLDLVHGVMSRKLWFPSKYFALNAVTLAGITVAMKLTVDLSGSMPGNVDQVAKLGSMAFMCTIMANFLPSLATMNKNELLVNIIALGVLVITLVVNICIQIKTGVVGRIPNENAFNEILGEESYSAAALKVLADLTYEALAIIYVVLLLLLLITHVSSSLAILKSKESIEQNYKQFQKTASKEEPLTVQQLQQHVTKYWFVARSSSPQFISACSATTAASGVICFLTFILNLLTIFGTIFLYSFEKKPDVVRYDSAYKKTTLWIFIVQSVGVIFGTVAPFSRCFSSIHFELTNKSMLNLFKVEPYWTGKLHDWKYGSIALPLLGISFPFGNHKLKVFIRTLKNLILNLFIILQFGVVVVCKIIMLVLFLPPLCWLCLKSLFPVIFSSSQTKNNEIYGAYVLQPENGMKLPESTMKKILISVNRLIEESEKKQPENLKKLLFAEEKLTDGFQGVKMFDVGDQGCWSLLVVTLTTIAVTLHNIEKKKVKSLLESVREGLEYVTLVEETLINSNDGDYERTQKDTKKLWEEVDFRHKWFGIKLKDITPQIVKQFSEKANAKIVEGGGSLDDNSKFEYICARSMSLIMSQTIISDQESHNELFDELSSRIADIMAACLTNLPQAIVKKCHTSVVEKREASVEAAAKLLGETKEIINTLQGPLQNKWHAYSPVDRKDRPFFNKWRASEP